MTKNLEGTIRTETLAEVFPYGRWNGDKGEHLAVLGKMATLAWIEASAFEKMPHSKPLKIDQSLLIDGVYVVPKA
jgi:hypothetical protein